MERRTYLVAAGVGVSTLLAGCLSEVRTDAAAGGSNDDGNGDEERTGDGESDGGGERSDDVKSNGDGERTGDGEGNGSGESSEDSENDEDSESNEDGDHGAVEVVEAYVRAASEEDLDALADTMHSSYPFNPDNLDTDETGEGDGWSYEWEEYTGYEVELADEDFSTSEIEELPYVDNWFANVADIDLDALLEGEEAALVSIAFEGVRDGETVEDEDQVIALTEDGEWTVFFEYEEPPEIPDGDPVDDAEYRIVDDLSFDEETERVTITLEDSIEIDFDEVVAYSESLETDSSISITGGGNLNYFTSGFDPDGDEIVVTARVDGEEAIVHREEYEE